MDNPDLPPDSITTLLQRARELQAPVPDKARLGDLLSRGELSPNDVRWVYLAELMARIRQEADETRARMNPIERAIHDETDARMESYLLFGTPDPPEIVGEPGALMRGAGIDMQGEADRIRARIEAARRAGTVDLLSPETAEALRKAMGE